MSVKQLWYTRNELRELGLDVSSTQFGRWEDDHLLTPIKVGGHRSAIVRYCSDEVFALIAKYTVRKVRPIEDLS